MQTRQKILTRPAPPFKVTGTSGGHTGGAVHYGPQGPTSGTR